MEPQAHEAPDLHLHLTFNLPSTCCSRPCCQLGLESLSPLSCHWTNSFSSFKAQLKCPFLLWKTLSKSQPGMCTPNSNTLSDPGGSLPEQDSSPPHCTLIILLPRETRVLRQLSSVGHNNETFFPSSPPSAMLCRISPFHSLMTCWADCITLYHFLL